VEKRPYFNLSKAINIIITFMKTLKLLDSKIELIKIIITYVIF